MKTNVTFSEALESCKEGKRIVREGWNGKGMFIANSPGHSNLHWTQTWGSSISKWVKDNGGKIEVLPYLVLKTADNKLLLGWEPNGIDLLANDWCILD
jgi:hypothetical protein